MPVMSLSSARGFFWYAPGFNAWHERLFCAGIRGSTGVVDCVTDDKRANGSRVDCGFVRELLCAQPTFDLKHYFTTTEVHIGCLDTLTATDVWTVTSETTILLINRYEHYTLYLSTYRKQAFLMFAFDRHPIGRFEIRLCSEWGSEMKSDVTSIHYQIELNLITSIIIIVLWACIKYQYSIIQLQTNAMIKH